MKISFKKTETRTVTEDVPDEFGHDDSLRGKVVDALLLSYIYRGRTVRDRLYDDDADTVEGAVHLLRGSYALADCILAAIKDDLKT